MLYSPEQCTQHYWEAFPTHTWEGNTGIKEANLSLMKADDIAAGFRLMDVAGRSTQVFSLETYPKKADKLFSSVHLDARDQLFRWLCQGASPSTYGYVGETCFHSLDA